MEKGKCNEHGMRMMMSMRMSKRKKKMKMSNGFTIWEDLFELKGRRRRRGGGEKERNDEQEKRRRPRKGLSIKFMHHLNLNRFG
jgi:hypothetical protein